MHTMIRLEGERLFKRSLFGPSPTVTTPPDGTVSAKELRWRLGQPSAVDVGRNSQARKIRSLVNRDSGELSSDGIYFQGRMRATCWDVLTNNILRKPRLNRRAP